MGYTRTEIEDSLGQAKYDDIFATYLLLGRKTIDVSSTTRTNLVPELKLSLLTFGGGRKKEGRKSIYDRVRE
jgi:hypothetical protein